MQINYAKYLDGDEWPSESGPAQVEEATGEYTPALEPVYDMVPQHAVSALHKLIRWARDNEITEEAAERAETEVRNSHLGRLLARKALRIEDFELYSEHGVSREALSNMEAAKAICMSVLNIAELDPMAAARLATDVALDLNNSGFQIIKED